MTGPCEHGDLPRFTIASRTSHAGDGEIPTGRDPRRDLAQLLRRYRAAGLKVERHRGRDDCETAFVVCDDAGTWIETLQLERAP